MMKSIQIPGVIDLDFPVHIQRQRINHPTTDFIDED